MDLTSVTAFRPAHERADLALGPGEALVAGGSWLFSEPQPGVRGLVDLTTMGWPDWQVDGDTLSIAATCTLTRLHALPVPPDISRLVRQCTDALAMSFKIQHVATIGGNLCLGLPAGALISLTAALDAVAVIWTPGGGERRAPVADVVRAPGVTSLAIGEVLRAVEVTATSLAARTAFRKTALNTIGRSASVVIGRVDDDGRTTISLTAATPRPVLLRFPALPSATELDDVVAATDQWYDDAHGAPDWRAAVTRTLAREVLGDLQEGR